MKYIEHKENLIAFVKAYKLFPHTIMFGLYLISSHTVFLAQ